MVAEGVEEPDQVCSLINLKCECVQGFYFHKPLKEKEALDLILSRDGEDSPRAHLTEVKRDCFEAGEAEEAARAEKETGEDA